MTRDPPSLGNRCRQKAGPISLAWVRYGIGCTPVVLELGALMSGFGNDAFAGPFHCLRRSPATAAIGIFQCLLCRAGRSSFPLGVLSHGRSFKHEANKWLFQESPLASCFRRSSLPNATGLSHGTNSQAGMGRGSLQSLQKLCAAFVAGISCQSLTAT